MLSHYYYSIKEKENTTDVRMFAKIKSLSNTKVSICIEIIMYHVARFLPARQMMYILHI